MFTFTDNVAAGDGGDELSPADSIVVPGHDPAIEAAASDLSFNPISNFFTLF